MSKHYVAVITKKTNSIWAGRGHVIGVDIKLGLVSVRMLTGGMKGHTGAFSLDGVRFERARASEVR